MKRHHAPVDTNRALRALYEEDPEAWVLPWAILPEVDYLLMTHVGVRAEEAFLADVAGSVYRVEWGEDADLTRARQLCVRHRALRPGLVDAVVVAVTERLHARAVATLDLRQFAVLDIHGHPRLLPRDLP
jgi:predicted nucleic acid-binding protein